MRDVRTAGVVGVRGLEPRASCSQSRRATNCATPRTISAYFTEFSQKSQARGREYHWESRESLDFWPGCWYSKDTIDISRKPLSDGIYPRLISAAPETKGTGHGLALLARRRKALPSRFPGAFNRNPGRHVPCGRAFCRFRFWEAENI